MKPFEGIFLGSNGEDPDFLASSGGVPEPDVHL
jgi:hypothetical protein